jgi:hypothetical protein
LVLVHLNTNRILELNPTAARFWELLRAGVQPEEAAHQMLAEYKVERDVLEREVRAMTAGLLQEKLLLEQG